MNFISRAWHSLTLRKRYHLLNYLARTCSYTRYLEIGVRNPKNNFERIRITSKEAVDPTPLAPIAHTMKSDDFFAMLDAASDSRRYDLIFIDGLHLADQVERDVDNSLRYLSPNGTLVLHDCNPPDEAAQTEDFDGTQKVWTGTVWKAWAKLRATRTDLSMCVVNIDLPASAFAPPDPPAPLSASDLSARVLLHAGVAAANKVNNRPRRAQLRGVDQQ